jgi:quercetin dioxygenase-like cupin family protein
MAATKTYATLSLADSFAEAEPNEEGRVRSRVRRELDVNSFGINAAHVAAAGARLIREHDETGPGSTRQEELYFVHTGRATFTVGGEEIDAPAGTFVFVPDPEAKRSAVAAESDTTIVMLGGTPGEAWRITPGEALYGFFEKYNAKDYEGALEATKEVLADYPGNGLILYNMACSESLLGRTDDAVAHLEQALEAAPSLAENARKDEDFDPIRDDPRFQKLVN